MSAGLSLMRWEQASSIRGTGGRHWRFGPELAPGSQRFQPASPGGDPGRLANAAVERALGTHGIVRHCRAFADQPALPALPMYAAVGPRRLTDGREPVSRIIGIGVSEVAAEARLKAIAEAVERYCFAVPHDPSLLLRAPYRDIEEWAIPPDRFGLFSDEQYATIPSLRRWFPGDAIDWAWAWSLTRERFALVPAVMAYATVRHQAPNNFLHGSTTTGLALHVSAEAAMLAGLYEVVERDALMLAWLHRRSPPQITLDAGAPSDLIHLVANHFTMGGVAFHLLDFTADSGIPTVACLAVSDDGRNAAAGIGSAARGKPAEAARKALLEAAQTLVGCRVQGWTAASALPEAEVRTLDDHAHFYAGAANAECLRFLLSSPEQVTLAEMGEVASGSVADDLRACINRLGAVGMEVLVVEVTPPDVARCGFRAVKVIVTGAVDLCGEPCFQRLGSERIHTVPIALGWPVDGGPLNRSPCPLA